MIVNLLVISNNEHNNCSYIVVPNSIYYMNLVCIISLCRWKVFIIEVVLLVIYILVTDISIVIIGIIMHMKYVYTPLFTIETEK